MPLQQSQREPTVELTASGKLWLGIAVSIVGALLLGIPWLMLSGMQSEYDAAAHEQSFKQATCTVKASRMQEVRVNDSNERVLEVEFAMQAEGETFDQLSYTYATHTSPGAVIPPGREVPCYYDPSAPTSVVLIQKAPPPGERPGAGLLHIFFSVLGVVLLAYGVHVLRTKRRLHLGDVPDYR